VVTQELSAGSDVDITLTLPAEITRGGDVFVRAQGKVVRVEPRVEDGEPRMGVAAVIERYDIVRGEKVQKKRQIPPGDAEGGRCMVRKARFYTHFSIARSRGRA